jgi:sRNA-binding protein
MSEASDSARMPPAKVVELLTDRFPNCFCTDGSERRPLKRGIFIDLFNALIGICHPDDLSAALRHYTSDVSYLRRCTKGAPRFNLVGEPDGAVSAEEAAYAEGQRRAKMAGDAPLGDGRRQ